MRQAPLLLTLCFVAACGSSNDGRQNATDDEPVTTDDDVAVGDDEPVGDNGPGDSGATDEDALDACANDNGGCDAHATCTVVAGAPQCTCQEFYAGDGTTCMLAVQVWSTWSGKPAAGGNATIPAGDVVYIDEDVSVGELVIEGELHAFGDQSFAMEVSHIKLGSDGVFEIGTAARAYQGQAVITFNGSTPGVNAVAATRGIDATLGSLRLVGAPPTPWTILTANAAAGSSTLELDDTTGWRMGDSIAVTPTDYYALEPFEAPLYRPFNTPVESTHMGTLVADPVGNTVEMASQLVVGRWGTLQTIDGVALDERAEVANLTRNIVLQGVDDAAWANDGLGVVVYGRGFYLDGVALRYAGYQSSRPVDSLGNTTVLRSSITLSKAGCIAMRSGATHRVRDNVCVGALGHGIGTLIGRTAAAVTDIVVEHNLVAGVRWPSAELSLYAPEQRDVTLGGSSGFIIASPHSTYRDNVAADVQGNGFWLTFSTGDGSALAPSKTRIQEFSGNRSHSNASVGVRVAHMFDTPEATPYSVALNGSGYEPRTTTGEPDPATVSAITAYRNAGGGVLFQGDGVLWQTSRLADNNRAAFVRPESGTGAYAVADGGIIASSANTSAALPSPRAVTGLEGHNYSNPTVTGTIWSGFTASPTDDYGGVLYAFSSDARGINTWLRGWDSTNVLAGSDLSWFRTAVPMEDPRGVLTGAPAVFVPTAYDAIIADGSCTPYLVQGVQRGRTCDGLQVFEVVSATRNPSSNSSYTLTRYTSFPSGTVVGSHVYEPPASEPFALPGAAVTSGAAYALEFTGPLPAGANVVTLAYRDGKNAPGAVIALPVSSSTTVQIRRTWRYYPPFGDITVTLAASYADFVASMGTKYWRDASRLYVMVGPRIRETEPAVDSPAFPRFFGSPIDVTVTSSN